MQQLRAPQEVNYPKYREILNLWFLYLKHGNYHFCSRYGLHLKIFTHLFLNVLLSYSGGVARWQL